MPSPGVCSSTEGPPGPPPDLRRHLVSLPEQTLDGGRAFELQLTGKTS